MKSPLRASLLLLLAATALANPARAEDVPPVVAAILKNWEPQLKSKPTYEKLVTDADGNIIITNLVAEAADDAAGGHAKYTVGSLQLANVAAEADGLIAVGSATFSDAKAEISGADNQSFTVDLPKGTAEGWYVPVAGDSLTAKQAFRASMSLARKISTGEVTFTTKGQTITSQGYESAWDGDPASGAGKFTMSLGNVVVPEAALATMDPTGQMKALGYGDLTFNFTGDGEITVNDTSFGMAGSVGISGKDMAAVKLSYGASDVPLAVMGEMHTAQQAGRSPDFNMLMPQLMNVSLDRLQLRFEDASITRKLLPVIAKMQGMEEAAMVANAGAMMQISLMQLKNQAFTDQVVGAVTAFLKDPKSLTVSLKPSAPVKVQQFMTLDPANPGAAIDLLGAAVTAND